MSAEDTSGSGLRTVFGLDLRSLALFRIGLGAVLLCDLVQRIRDAESLYSDFGILPRPVLLSEFSGPWDWSLHAFAGQPAAVTLLFVVYLAFALSLLVGYRTRLSTAVCWVLIVSVQHRNEFVGHGGDQLLRTLFLWGMFLPLGARWSVDSALHADDRSRAPAWMSVGTVALVLQTCFIYWSTLLLKWHPDWWQGRAVGMALEIDQYLLPVGLLVRDLTWLLPLLTWLTLAVELAGPLLLLLPLAWGWQRLFAVALMLGLHVGFGLCLNLLAFSATSAVFWLAFVPSCFWEWLLLSKAPPDATGVRIVYDADCLFCFRVAHFVRGLLGLPRSVVGASSENAQMQALIDRENSWVVERADGGRFFRYEAFLALLPYSFLGRATAWFWQLGALRSAGDHAYRLVAANRQALSPLVSWLRTAEPLPAGTRTYRVGQGICVILIAVSAISIGRRLDVNPGGFFKEDVVTGLQRIGLLSRPPGYDPQNPPRQPAWLDWGWYDAIDGPMSAVLLKQSWGMFAPSPMVDDGWFVIVGTRVDGTREELYNRGQFRYGESAMMADDTWDKPEPVVDVYPSARWRKYLYRLWIEGSSSHRAQFSAYLTRVYDRADRKRFGEAARSGGKRLLLFEIYYMLERTRPEGGHHPLHKKLIATHRCY